MPRRGKDKSKIFLFAVCRRKSQAIFDGRRGSFFFQKKDGFSPNSFGVGGNIGIVKNSPFFPRFSHAFPSDSGSPQIPLESEGTAVLLIPKESERKARCFSLCPAGAEEKNTGFPPSHIWLGGNAPLPSKIACDFRRQRSGPPKIL